MITGKQIDLSSSAPGFSDAEALVDWNVADLAYMERIAEALPHGLDDRTQDRPPSPEGGLNDDDPGRRPRVDLS